MLEIIKSPDETDDGIIGMGDMKPFEIGVIVRSSSTYDGHYIMRTYDSTHFEILDLTDPADGSWTVNKNFNVRLLGRGESITVKLFNEGK